MPRVTVNEHHVFDVAEGETLLDGALRAGIVIDHSCRTGRCGVCRARVEEGGTTVVRPETGLSPAEAADGLILTCCRQTQADLALSADNLLDASLPEPRIVPSKIQSLRLVAPDVMAVTLRLPPATTLPFLAGQYVNVSNKAGTRRAYSIASPPNAQSPVELHIRNVPGGAMSSYWFEQARENDLLRLHGPFGSFFLRDDTGKDIIFLATGTGVAPICSMIGAIASLSADTRPRSVTLAWGGRMPSDIYLTPYLEHDRFAFIPTLSRAGADWIGDRGYVQNVALARAGNLSRSVVYACGSPAMIQDARAVLVQGGLPAGNFHSDAFVCSG